MASPSAKAPELGQVLVDFSVDGAFPEDEAVSAARATSSVLPAAAAVLNQAKKELELEVQTIGRESAPDVDAWITNAKSVQQDLEQCKRLSNQIVRHHEAAQEHAEETQEKEKYVGFLEREVAFQDQLLASLRQIQHVNALLDEGAVLAEQKNVLDALYKLEESYKFLVEIPLDKTVRAIRLLDLKSFELRRTIHDRFSAVWSDLVAIDPGKGSITIIQKLGEGGMTMDQVITGLKSFNELENTAQQFWQDFDDIILGPRTDLEGVSPNPRTLVISGNTIKLGPSSAGHTIKSLFNDIEQIIRFLQSHLPSEIIQHLSKAMMPVLAARILDTWLETAVPPELDDMVDYQKALAMVGDFSKTIENLGWPGLEGLQDWVANAPKIWLNKRREIALDWVRNALTLGIGQPQVAERVEKRMVPRDEADAIPSAGITAVTQEWDAAWDSDAPEEPPITGRNRKSIDEERRASEILLPAPNSPDDDVVDDDAADAWGWGDEDDAEEAEPAAQVASAQANAAAPPADRRVIPEVREMKLSEKYWISSLPQSVFNSVVTIFEDGARLSRAESETLPVTPAAPGLFGLPSLILALYRAVSPHYYSIAPGGNMYLYNDAFWLSEKFAEFVSSWAQRTDLPPRAFGMSNKLQPEIQILVSFSKRAYTNELRDQRMVVKDLLGGTQNFFQQEGRANGELGRAIQVVIDHVRLQATLWETILPYSVWASAIGSLVNSIAAKLIADVFDLSDIGVDEAERVATILSKVESLDNLFIPKDTLDKPKDEQIPLTAQFADKWMKMKFLGEVLQSNLKDVKFLWFESDLSLYFTVAEVVEVIALSFEMNSNVKALVREIKSHPKPRDL